MYLLEEKKTETVIPKTMEKEVTDNRVSSLGIPHLQLTSFPSCADQLEQNMQPHKIYLLSDFNVNLKIQSYSKQV